MRREGCQVLVVGAGIIGLTIARELLRQGVEDVLILEKESSIGAHASGRNSGVLHTGVYYTPDTLKAKFCVQGNRLMKEFCRENGLTLRETGKVIVARGPSDIEQLNELHRRTQSCGARGFFIGTKELSEIEPHATTYEKALFLPDTAIVSPKQVLKALEAELAHSRKAMISYATAFEGLQGERKARTSTGVIQFEWFVNAAGAYADRVAHQFGLAREYKALPFKGTYMKLRPDRASLVRGNIYPVPDLRNPFLGVHLTRSVDDEVYVGPTAIPALGQENYRLFDGWNRDTLAILFYDGVLLIKNQAFRRVALTEPKKYLRRFIWEEAQSLVPELTVHDLTGTDKIGIRPQLIHWPTKKLVMDFVVLRDGQTLHILNAISPAFTSSMAFAQYTAAMLLGKKGGAGHALSVPVSRDP